MKQFLTHLTLLLFFTGLFTSCEKPLIPVKKKGTNKNVVGSWYGSFNYHETSLVHGNILITFRKDLSYSIDREIEVGSFTFEASNGGTFDISDGKLSLTSLTCENNDPDCEISDVLSGQSIRILKDRYKTGLQINSSQGWHFYEGQGKPEGN